MLAVETAVDATYRDRELGTEARDVRVRSGREVRAGVMKTRLNAVAALKARAHREASMKDIERCGLACTVVSQVVKLKEL